MWNRPWLKSSRGRGESKHPPGAETSAIRDVMSTVHENIMSAPLDNSPFPHFVVDGVLDDEMLRQVGENWPDPEHFTETGIPGNYLFHLKEQVSALPPEKADFWKRFANDVIDPAVKATFANYGHIFEKKYGDLLRHVSYPIKLFEVGDNFGGHEIHTHHWHDPTWLFTNLLYIDERNGEEQSREVPGTSLYGHRHARFPGRPEDSDDLAFIAAQTLQWEDMEEMTPEKTVEFTPNRLLSFVDSPIFFHGVELPRTRLDLGRDNEGGVSSRPRRIVRLHALAPRELIPPLYGNVTPGTYDVHRRRASKKDFVLEWLRHEIDNLEISTREISKERTLIYTQGIDFQGDFPVSG